MRPDLDKVIVERPRRGGMHRPKGFRDKQTVRNDFESAPTKEPLRSKRERTKSFNEHLAPLRRLLRKNVGRPYDKVKSEIIEALGGGRGTLQNHVLDHLKNYVEENVILKDGVPYQYFQGGLVLVNSGHSNKFDALYVCPKSGLLKIAKSPPPKKKTDYPKVHRLDDFHAVLYFRGNWSMATLKDVNQFAMHEYDAYFGRDVPYYTASDLWGKREIIDRFLGKMYKVQRCTELRPMTRAEIRALPFDTKTFIDS